jgi:putative salt-induced outer membrane protein YdiY
MFVTALLVVAGIAGHAQTTHAQTTHAQTTHAPITCRLANGDRLSGDMLSITRTQLRIQHDVLGELLLNRDAIAVCESKDSAAHRRLGALALAPLTGTSLTTVTVPSAASAVARLPDHVTTGDVDAHVAASLERLIHPARVVPLAARALPTYVSHVGWKRLLGTTYMLSRGNANVSSLGFTGSIARRADRSQIALHAKREFGTQDGAATENYLSATLRYDLALGPDDSAAAARPSFFTEAVFEHDPFAKIGRRAVENSGLSVPLSRNPHSNLALEIGSGVTNEMPTGGGPGSTRFGGLLRLAARQLFGSASADQQIAIFPDLGGPHAHYRVNADINLVAPIAKAVALKIGFANRYDTRPQADVRKHDTTIQSGIAVEF